MKHLFFCVTFIVAIYFTQNTYGLYENDMCTNSNGKKGICKKNEDCSRLQDILKTGLRPKICGWPSSGRYPIICCPLEEKPEINTQPPDTRRGSAEDTDRSKQVQLVRQKCAEYGKFVKEEIEDPALGSSGKTLVKDHCGRLAEAMILGGIEAKPREFPHMALIGYGDPPVYLCGGSLISERYVLSAAHCSKPPRRGSAKAVKLGELDTSTDFDEADPVVYQIIQIINHPQYDPATLYNDISLFKLHENVIFTAFIRPICLDTNLEIPLGFLAASGWGHTEWGGTASSKLMKVSLEYVTADVCNYNYTKTIELGKQIPRGVLDESMVCAGNEVGKDACQGDSGGPLQANLTEPYCMYDLVGITSFGKGCGLGYPGVYTRVSYYIPWIVQHVWPENK